MILTTEEKKILELKYAGKRFRFMDNEELLFSAKTLLFKISAITGWTLPMSELLTVLVDQFSKTLSERYENANIEEFEYAFRNKGIYIKDWGKSLNISLMDEIMIPYFDKRLDLSMQEESKKSAPIMLDNRSKNLTDNEWAEWLKDIRKYDFKVLPSSAYDYLEKKREIVLTAQQKHEYMDRAISYMVGNFDPISPEGIKFAGMKKDGVFSYEITGTLKTFAKRFALQDYFNLNPGE